MVRFRCTAEPIRLLTEKPHREEGRELVANRTTTRPFALPRPSCATWVKSAWRRSRISRGSPMETDALNGEFVSALGATSRNHAAAAVIPHAHSEPVAPLAVSCFWLIRSFNHDSNFRLYGCPIETATDPPSDRCHDAGGAGRIGGCWLTAGRRCRHANSAAPRTTTLR